MSRTVLRLGTRASRLALWQAQHVAERLQALPGAPAVEIVEIRTEGDRITSVPLSEVPGKSFFTKEIEQSLTAGQTDLAVHSLKDLATILPAGLVLGAVLEREDPRDVLLARDGRRLDQLPANARVGTSSLRRRAFLRRWRPELEIAELRGNVPTRLRKLQEGAYDAIVLAAAGVSRLGLGEHVTEHLPVDRFPPAVSQGAIGLQIRDADEDTRRWVAQLEDPATRLATTAERALLRRLEGGCQVPVGALGIVENAQLHLQATICSLDGQRAVNGETSGPVADSDALGTRLAEDLLARGGQAILDEIRDALAEAAQ